MSSFTNLSPTCSQWGQFHAAYVKCLKLCDPVHAPANPPTNIYINNMDFFYVYNISYFFLPGIHTSSHFLRTTSLLQRMFLRLFYEVKLK